MTTPRIIDTPRKPAASSPTTTVTASGTRREYRERDFGVGYGRSSGYAGGRQYASNWTGASRFRCG